ncbi:MAG: PA2779 family protein, partial [Gammaproteobacteria bacterium]|nr:PA2779 family protein [Gammaproteobacteria bacterium]
MKYRKFTAVVLSAALAWAGFTTAAMAAVVGTADALAMEQKGSRLAAVQAGLARSGVQQAMIDMGVDPVQAQLRVAALDDQALAQLQDRLDQLPAGGILELI